MSSPAHSVSSPSQQPDENCHETAKEIIADIQKREKSGPMTPETRKLGRRLRRAATKSLNGGEVDQQLLVTGWKSFTKALDQAQAARKAQEAYDEKIAHLNENLEDANAAKTAAQAEAEKAACHLRNIEFLVEIGDSVSSVLKGLGSTEKCKIKDILVLPPLRHHYKELGMSADDAQAAAITDSA